MQFIKNCEYFLSDTYLFYILNVASKYNYYIINHIIFYIIYAYCNNVKDIFKSTSEVSLLL